MLKIKKLYMPLLISSILNTGYVYASSEVNTVNSSTPDEKTSPARIAFNRAIEMMQEFALDESGNMKHPKAVVEAVEECKKNSNCLERWKTTITEGSEDRHIYYYVDYIYDIHALFPPHGNRTVCLRYLSYIRPTTATATA
ncbi:MAG: hypothetical protein NT128_02325, partial [Proteobacteria bacterium]|nr:hypothetical protein [Pseudomonadota bacterium]